MDWQRRILLIDNDRMTLNLFKYILEKKGFIVFTTENSQEADQIIKEQRNIDLIITEAYLGEKNASAINRAISYKKYIPQVKIIIMSYFHGLLQIKKLPVDECILKPIEVESMLTIIEKVLSENTSYQKLLTGWPFKSAIHPLNKFLGVDFEGLEGCNYEDNKRFRWTAYDLDQTGHITIGVTASKGCEVNCFNCLSKEKGYVRDNTVNEICSQVYHGLGSFLAFQAFKKIPHGPFEFTVNSTCGGDWMYCQKPTNTLDAFKLMSEIRGVRINFILTSVGCIKTMEKILRSKKYRQLLEELRPTLYFSINYPDDEVRWERMPGTKGQLLKDLIDLHVEFSKITGQPNVISMALYKEKNCNQKYAEVLAKLIVNKRKYFEVKAMAAENIPELAPSDSELDKFCEWVKKYNILCWTHKIVGGKYGYGCGSTWPSEGETPET
ncbi:MAG: response regulator [Patescibacteria group bacterium]